MWNLIVLWKKESIDFNEILLVIANKNFLRCRKYVCFCFGRGICWVCTFSAVFKLKIELTDYSTFKIFLF